MQELILLYQWEHYSILINEPQLIYLLGYFLVDEVGNSAEHFIKWFENPANANGSGGLYYSEYDVEDGIVTFVSRMTIDYVECYAKGNYFEIRIPILVDLLKQWDALIKVKPQYIRIVIDDAHVHASGAEEKNVMTIRNMCFILVNSEKKAKAGFIKSDLFILLRIIDRLYIMVSQCNYLYEATEYLDMLQKIHTLLAPIASSYPLNLSLQKFIDDCEQLTTSNAHNQLFGRIKKIR